MDRSEMNYGFAKPEFRENHLVLKEKIRNLKRNSEVLQCHHFHKICMDVEEKILNFDEEPTLSVLHNKVRKLDTGSELCKEICLLQRHFSNMEISRAVSEVLEKEKYEKISNKIMLRKQLELKREIFFKKQAAHISKQCPEEKEDQEAELLVIPPTETVSVAAETLQSPNLKVEEQGTSLHLNKSGRETARNVGLEDGNLVDEKLRISNMSGIRVTDIPSSIGDITVPEMEARKIDHESEFNVDLNELERILENGIADLEEIPIINGKTGIRDLTNGDAAQCEDLENLPPVSSTRARRKKRYLPVFDRCTNIRHYSKRARRLNASVNVERVQVYAGPPSILHAFKIEHVLETPAVNNGYSGAVRSSVIQRLYTRHQKTVQASDKNRDELQPRRSVAQEIPIGVEEIMGQRLESRSDVQKSMLSDISAIHTDRTEMREAAIAQNHEMEVQVARLMDTSVSKIRQEDVVLPFIEASDPRPPQSSRTSNRQDKSLDGPTADPRFKPIELSAPREKWREFKYVRKCLEDIWMEKEGKNLEKGASLLEVLDKEHEWGKENMLTLLRIVDKMSLRREVVIKGRGLSVIIQPFEIPFVTEKQYSLREHAPTF